MKKWYTFPTVVLFTISLYFFNCTDKQPTEVNETFELTIVSPSDSSIIDKSLQIILSSETYQIKQANFYIDNYPSRSEILEKNSYLVDISNWADDSLHTIKVICSEEGGSIGYSNQIIVRILKSAKYHINIIEPKNELTIRDTNRINIRWLNSFVFSKYKLEIASNFNFTELIFSEDVNGNGITSPVLNKDKYFWRLQASLRDTDAVIISEIRSFTIDSPLPPLLIMPVSSEITNSNNEVLFKWNKSLAAVQYELQVTDVNTQNIISNDLINDDTLFSKNLAPGGYSWKVRAKNKVGYWSDWSYTARFGNGVFYKVLDLNINLHSVQVEEFNNGDFLLLGTGYPISSYSYIVKSDPLGSILWTKQIDFIGLNAFEISEDGSCIMAGEERYLGPGDYGKSKIIKIDGAGNIIWEKIYSDSLEETLYSITQTPEGYIACGLTRTPQTIQNRSIILKISSDGDLLWRKEFSIDDPRKQIVFYNSGEIITLGYIRTSTYNSIVFMKFDNAGNELKRKIYDGWLTLGDAIKTKDNNLVFTGSVSSNYGMYIKKIDFNGDIIMESEFNTTIPRSISDVAELENGEFGVAGYNYNSGMDEGIYFAKIGQTGIVINEVYFDGITASSLTSTKDGGFIILGSNEQNDMILIKTNNKGQTFYP